MSPWEPMHVDRGMASRQNAVTVFAANSPIQVSNGEARDPEGILASFTDALFVPGPGQEEVVVVLCPELVGHMESAGWSKSQVKESLFEAAQRSTGSEDDEARVRAVASPEGIAVIVAGGAAGAFSAIIPLWSGGSNSRPITREIRAP